jgi:predicted NACHT family NTPase
MVRSCPYALSSGTLPHGVYLHQATHDHVLQFINSELGKTLQKYAPALQRELFEKGGLILFDGLDEVPEADQRREQIKQAVEDFATTFPLCRVLVTSRTYAYQKQDWRLPSFDKAVLAPFTEGQICRFVDRWYPHFVVLHGLDKESPEMQANCSNRRYSVMPTYGPLLNAHCS